MDWRTTMTAGLDLRAMVGAEIGPLDRPAVRRSDGRILYVDHADTPALRRKYASDPSVRIDDIVDVDIVWGSTRLAEAFGTRHPVDYVVASHVIEHVPNMIGWLDELRGILRPGGLIKLAVPDRRATFDICRRETDLVDLLVAYVCGATRPQLREILDAHAFSTRGIDAPAAWAGTLPPEAATPMATLPEALAYARAAAQDGEYHDVHCWVFTPSSFAALFRTLATAGWLPFACDGFHDTAFGSYEFFVTLRQCDDQAETVASWESLERRLAGEANSPCLTAEATASLPDTDRLREDLRRSVTECSRLRTRIAALEGSRTWRFAAPVRGVADRLRRLRAHRAVP